MKREDSGAKKPFNYLSRVTSACKSKERLKPKKRNKRQERDMKERKTGKRSHVARDKNRLGGSGGVEGISWVLLSCVAFVKRRGVRPIIGGWRVTGKETLQVCKEERGSRPSKKEARQS